MGGSYYVEYVETADEVIRACLEMIRIKYPKALCFGKYDAEIPVRYLIHVRSSQWQWWERYHQMREAGKSRDEVKELLYGELKKEFPYPPSGSLRHEKKRQWRKKWEESLISYKGVKLVYLFNERQLRYLMPVLETVRTPLLLITEFAVPAGIVLPDYVTVMEFRYIEDVWYDAPFLEAYFPRLYYCFNTFCILLDVLRPSQVILLEGCHYQQQTLAVIARRLQIPSVCIQQGWPSLMHTCYRDMQFDRYLTWGEEFSRWWKMYNPAPVFEAAGYLSDVLPARPGQRVTFFLPSPFFAGDPAYLAAFVDLAAELACLFPDRIVAVREHPDYKLQVRLQSRFSSCPNVFLVTEEPLASVFAATEVVVSHFSSSLLEGMAHGCIPFVFDLAGRAPYFPDIEQEGIGLTAVSKEEAMAKMTQLLTDPETVQRIRTNQDRVRPHYFRQVSAAAVREMVTMLQ